MSFLFFRRSFFQKKYFSKTDKLDAYIENDGIYYNNELVINFSDIKLKGMHNYENIMACIIAVKEFGVENEIIKEFLSTFSGVEHRLEYVRTLNGVDYYNDSKSTNNEATITALKTFKNPTILIMGGLDRNIPFDDLSDYVENVKAIVCYGQTKNKIKEFADNNNLNCYVLDNLNEAVSKAYEISETGDTVLLSPACASWDQFKTFEERGELFKSLVGGLK